MPQLSRSIFVFNNPAIRRNQTALVVVGQDSKAISAERGILHSWKQISAYLGLGVRTVQRYEIQLQLPVHRPAARTRSSVMAFSDELDAWLRKTPTRDSLDANRRDLAFEVKRLKRHDPARTRILGEAA